ncbi:hypothetical protein [Streptomyces manipurensis]|uniref:hypothetical protein n=1 Tax=Streptomyces manipurensis TaxID=1077945 RepID=UPI003C700BB8
MNPTRRPVVPHTVPMAGRALHVGWFTEQDPDKLILLSCTVGRRDSEGAGEVGPTGPLAAGVLDQAGFPAGELFADLAEHQQRSQGRARARGRCGRGCRRARGSFPRVLDGLVDGLQCRGGGEEGDGCGRLCGLGHGGLRVLSSSG